MSRDRYHMDMCNGPLFRKIIWFALPLIATGALQQLFSAADLIVVGRYATYQDMAAVGACIPVSGLIVNVFFGISVGAGVLT
ncbi:MAG: MATE family efflux transporter, partial [Lentisphaeria bacterium]|nr:MATE family efflux transporter [Lentisphaeria bacterium]